MAGRIGLIGTLCLVPVTVILRWLAPDRCALTFVVAGLAIVPLAGSRCRRIASGSSCRSDDLRSTEVSDRVI
jgi:hypothetical protein